LEDSNGFSFLKLAGVIDEDNKLNELSVQLRHDLVVIHLGGVERINSCGVRDWVNWLTGLQRGKKEVYLVECSPAIVAQLNLVNNFTGGGGVVHSFYAPYFCSQCSKERTRLLLTDEVANMDPPKAPPFRCDECEGPMDFDDLEDSYFAFVKHVERKALPAIVQSALNQSGAGKRLEGKLAALEPSKAAKPSSAPVAPAPVAQNTALSPPASTSPARPIAPAPVSSPPMQAEEKKSNAMLLVIVVVLLAVAAGVVYFLMSGKKSTSTTVPSNTPTAVASLSSSGSGS
jgi:anti-anti-sigma regulatory factor